MTAVSSSVWLQNILVTRQEKNPAYSLRAFARDLGISAPLVSQMLSGHRKITANSILKIVEALGLDPQDYLHLIGRPKVEKVDERLVKFSALNVDHFKLIADWYHYAILSLADVKGAKADADWIAERLGIGKPEAKAALERLFRLRIIKRQGQGFVQIAPPIDSTHDIPSSAVKKQHRQLLEIAQNSLLNDPVADRYFGAVTLSFKATDMDKAKKILRKFRAEFSEKIESKEADRVYTMSLQFFPIDQNPKNPQQKKEI